MRGMIILSVIFQGRREFEGTRGINFSSRVVIYAYEPIYRTHYS